MDIPYIPAKQISYGGERAYNKIQYIVIHYTANDRDTASGNCRYFANGNTRSAGAHFFVSQNGDICQSVQMKKKAYSVGDKKKSGSGGTYYGKCTNANSVSIELCDNLKKDPSAAQTEAVRQLVAYIQSVCPNAKTILRHYDVTNKLCPARMANDTAKWNAFKVAITKEDAAPVQPKKEEEEVTKEEIQEMIDDSIRRALQGAGSHPSVWAEEEYGEAVALGITDGSRPLGYATREESVILAKRAAEKMMGRRGAEEN